ncbi:MAG TPA: methionyl-tRNA formyltransferase [Candidatus Bathyarchaeia archaeon]|nr:methionyl-tRNA formyltransferase [Candidatus Bathyarchaeia archaeon]
MENKQIRIIFFGTPDFAVGILKSLLENYFQIAAVFSQPDKKIGRKQEVVPPPVKRLAVEKGIKIFQPESLRDSSLIEKIENIKPDLFIVAAYGKILPKEILEIPKYGAINIHASLLPKYRGASPVQCAILSGEKETGVTLMKMNEKMDEGDILVQEKVQIGENDKADSLMKKLGNVGAKLSVDFIPEWILGKTNPIPQDQKKATYCKPVKREDGKIDWRETAGEIFRKWRAYHPWPGIFARLNAKNQQRRLKFLEIDAVAGEKTGGKPGEIIRYNQGIAVQTKKGLLILKKIQLEGKNEMAIVEFLKGYPNFVGTVLE